MMNQKAMNQELRVFILFLRRSALEVEPLLPSRPSVEICSRFPLRSLRSPVEGFPLSVLFGEGMRFVMGDPESSGSELQSGRKPRHPKACWQLTSRWITGDARQITWS